MKVAGKVSMWVGYWAALMVVSRAELMGSWMVEKKAALKAGEMVVKLVVKLVERAATTAALMDNLKVDSKVAMTGSTMAGA
jgi:hypothetical protein